MFKAIVNTIKNNKEVISNMPTTNFKTVVAIYAGVLSVVAYWIATFFLVPIDSVSLGLLFGFILTWLFDGRKQFEIKRKTQWKPNGMDGPAFQPSAPIKDSEEPRDDSGNLI
jgi:hypothetical protein